MKQKKVLLKDIAQEVGVSTALVSYVLNNQKENRIGKEIAEKIRATAKALNYQPNQIAKSLKTQKTNTIGLIVADIANLFSAQIARIIEDEASKQGYTVIFGSSDEKPEKMQELINVLINRQVDGFIIAPVVDSQPFLEDLAQKGVPFVLIDRYFPSLPFSYIGIDNAQSVFDAVTHLIDTGRKQIAIINYETTLFHLKERTRGYEKALKSSFISIQKDVIVNVSIENMEAEIGENINRLMRLEPPIDALLFAANNLAISGLKHIRNRKIKIPEQLAVVAYDETDAYHLFATPITYVKQPLEEIGKQAVLGLLNQIQNNDNSLVQLNLNTTLIIQASST